MQSKCNFKVCVRVPQEPPEHLCVKTFVRSVHIGSTTCTRQKNTKLVGSLCDKCFLYRRMREKDECVRWGLSELAPVAHTLGEKKMGGGCVGGWVMECVSGRRRGSGVMSVCSQCKWHLSSSDRLSLSPCNGDPVREPFPSVYPPKPHLHRQFILFIYLFCSDSLKLPTFQRLSIRPLLCIIFNQSSPLLSKLLILFVRQVYSSKKGRKETEK